MVIVNAIALIIIVGGGGWLNWDDLKQAWVRFKERVKTAWNSCERCKDVRAYIIKNPNISFSYALFGLLSIVFVPLFFWWVYPFIKMLYIDIKTQIDGVTIGSPAYRNVSLSIAGSITLSIALLGLILTVIRNLLTRQQNRTDEQRLVTEQISRGIEQIGAYKQGADEKSYEPNIEVRLGGLYSLQRIMQNSPKDEDTIARIFYAYVRENAKRRKTGQLISKIPTPGLKIIPNVKIDKEIYPLPEDIQAVISIINRFNKNILPDSQLNFSRTIFKQYYLIGMNFSHWILKYADFTGSNLSGADLSYADLTGGDLSDADLVDVDLFRGILTDTKLVKANLSGGDLSYADLSYSDIRFAKLFGVDLTIANLHCANLHHADLTVADLCDADLTLANLGDADLMGADLSGADLSGADLSGADLRIADLSSAKNLTQEQINKAKGNKNTKLPDGLIPPISWKDANSEEIIVSRGSKSKRKARRNDYSQF